MDETTESTYYSVVFTFTHDVIVERFSSQGITESCFINSTLFTRVVKFECASINYDNFYEVEFKGLINLSNGTFPLQFIVTFGTEHPATKEITG